MAEGEEYGKVKHLVPSVADVDVFTVKSSSSFGAIVQESRVVLEADWEGEGKFGTGVYCAEEDICNCISGFVATVPLMSG
jgi:hypothetical protein